MSMSADPSAVPPDEDDGYPYDEEEPFDCDDDFDCGMDSRGNCGKAGSEECEWECPYGRIKKN